MEGNCFHETRQFADDTLYLHDDFNAIRLKEKVIAQPPVLLWPDLAAAQNVPPDVYEQLNEELAKDVKR